MSPRDKENPKQCAIKQADLDMLELAAAADEIDLLYLDESGFSLWSLVSYSYFIPVLKCSNTGHNGRLRVFIYSFCQPIARK